MNLNLILNIPGFFLLCFFLIFNVHAEELNQSTNESSSLGEQLENLGLIYKDKSNENLQELWLLGRYHGQYYLTQTNGEDPHDYETRRFRLGTQAKLFDKFTFHAQMVSGSDIDPFYNGFTELWGQWAFSDEIIFTLGQQKHRFTHDRNVSSRYLNYLERSMLTNMFSADYTPAVTLQGKIDKINYYTGIFSNATGRNMKDSFTEYDSGYSFLAAAYYELDFIPNAESAYIHASYLHSDANQNATNLDRYDDGISTAFIMTDGSLSFITEATAGIDSEQGNAWGINVQPGVFLTDKLQLVGRYQLAFSNNKEGLVPQARYEQEADLTSDDIYQAGYAGLNYHIAKHRLKLMSGVEYAQIGPQESLTFSAMVRFYFGPHSGGAFPMNQMLPGFLFDFD